MRKENYTIAIIGGTSTSEELKTIKQLLEECIKEGSETIVELQLPELQETCIIREVDQILELQERSRTIEKNLTPEYCEITENLGILEQTAKSRSKRYEKSKKVLDNKQYKEPYITTRHYWRGNIK